MKETTKPVDEPLPNTMRFVYALGAFILVGWIVMALFVLRSW